MGVSGIIAIVSLVFSVSHGSISLILAWRKDRKNDKNSTDNVEILRNKNEILATDSKNKAEHFKNEEKLSEQSIATLEKLTQTVTKLLERDSAPQMIDESKKELIVTDDEHLQSEQ